MKPRPRMSGEQAALIRAHHRPFSPIPTGQRPVLTPLRGIRTVVFDIYGTMMLSAAGDIGIHEETTRAGLFREAATATGFSLHVEPESLEQAWTGHIRTAHAEARTRGVAFPEVEIRDIWNAVLTEGLIAGPADRLDRLAIEYELRSNPVTLEPTLRQTLAAFRERDLPLGIISNAQFYTPVILETLLDFTLDEAGFNRDLCVWSYQEREGKPAQTLYLKLAEQLADRDIHPEQVLYVGNDMLKDILPAARTGFRTALYAGDRRSLRLRDDHLDCRGLHPDLVVTELAQLLAITGQD